MTEEQLLEWAEDMLCSPEDWKWLWSWESAETPLLSPMSPLLPPPYDASSASLLSMSTSNALSTSALFVEPLHLVTPSEPVPCAPALFAENLVMWAPLTQPQPWLAHTLSLSEWVTSDDLELVPQGYSGGNVMIEEPSYSFSPFSASDCTLFSHFSFDDFVAVAFLDLAGDLNVQI